MAETLEKKIEIEMAKIAGLYSISKGLDQAKVPSEQSRLVAGAIDVIASDVPEDDPKYADNLQNLRVQYDCPPHIALTKIGVSLGVRVKDIKPYYDEHKDLVYDLIKSKLNEVLAEADSKAKAVDSLLQYLAPLFDIPEITQEQADALELANFAKAVRMPYITKPYFGAGSIDAAKASIYRQKIADYVVEKEQGDKKTYTIDDEKLKEVVVKSPVIGSLLYTLTHSRED